MAINDISLTSGMRSNLVNLQSTVSLINRTQTRLSTGKKVNSPLDDPTRYFVAQDHVNRASDLAARKDGMGEAIQNVQAASSGIDGITKLLEAAKGLAESARSADTAGRDSLATQYDTLLTQIDQLATDSGYKGVNLLNSDTLKVDFNENATSTLSISGFDASSSGLGVNAVIGAGGTSTTPSTVTTVTTANVSWASGGIVNLADGTVNTTVRDDMNANPQNYRIVDSATGGTGGIATGNGTLINFASTPGGDYEAALVSGSFSAGEAVTVQYDANGFDPTTGAPNPITTTTPSGNAWDTNGGIDTSEAEIHNAETALRSQSARLSSNLSVITIRQDFTTSMVNTLQQGSDNLTLADMNEEGANMLALQTKQSLGTSALSLASQSAQSVLKLFG
jgi:flagellin